MVAVFDAMPRLANEEQWREALEDELLDMLQERCRAIGFGEDVAFADLEQGLVGAVSEIQDRIRQAIAERQAAASGMRPLA
jgi:hypothetical protein